MKYALSGTTDGINKALNQSVSAYNQLSKEVDNIFDSVSTSADTSSKGLSGLATQVDDITKKYTEFKGSLQKVQNALPANEKVLITEIDKIIGKIDQSIIQQKEIRKKLKDASDEITLASGTTTLYRKDLKKQIKQSAKDISSIQDSYEKKVQTNLTKLVNSLTVNNGSVSKVVNNLNQGTSDVSKLAGDSGAQLGQLKKILKNSGKALGKASKNVSNISFKIVKTAMQQNCLKTY